MPFSLVTPLEIKWLIQEGAKEASSSLWMLQGFSDFLALALGTTQFIIVMYLERILPSILKENNFKSILLTSLHINIESPEPKNPIFRIICLRSWVCQYVGTDFCRVKDLF